MNSIQSNSRFGSFFEQLGRVKLNPRRHTASTARQHSEAVADLAVRLGQANGSREPELQRLHSLGLAHDIGKVRGSARPDLSVDVLRECGITDEDFLALVKWHDVALPWFNAERRGQSPSPKAWAKLTRAVDLSTLCLFMVADRVDAPGGWRGNAPTTWFMERARAQGFIGHLIVDVPDHPSLVSAGGVVIRFGEQGREALLIRVRSHGYEIPKGRIEWDELPEQAAARECVEETGLQATPRMRCELGPVDYVVETEGEQFLKRVRYFLFEPSEEPRFAALPRGTRERVWLSIHDVERVPLVNERLRPILLSALEK